MAKLDLKAAYRHVPVHPDDQSLLAIRWGGATYLDTALPFGLSSAPKAMADGLSWCMLCEGVSHFLHYLDDFFCPPQQPGTCQQSLRTAVNMCEYLGFPVAPEKVVGPATTLIFLGIELDSVKMEMRLPREKLDRIPGMVADPRVCHKETTTIHSGAIIRCGSGCTPREDIPTFPRLRSPRSRATWFALTRSALPTSSGGTPSSKAGTGSPSSRVAPY